MNYFLQSCIQKWIKPDPEELIFFPSGTGAHSSAAERKEVKFSFYIYQVQWVSPKQLYHCSLKWDSTWHGRVITHVDISWLCAYIQQWLNILPFCQLDFNIFPSSFNFMVFSLVLTGSLSSSPSLHTLSYFFRQPSRLYSSLPIQICCCRIFPAPLHKYNN